MIGVVLGTGPSLAAALPLLRRPESASRLTSNDVRAPRPHPFLIFGVNNTYQDVELDVWIACDPAWHEVYSPVVGNFDKWHWDRDICERFTYRYIEGRWGDGLSTDASYIHYGHSSGYQALGLARHYGCDPILLVGYDMKYEPGKPRHYFDDLSDEPGEYPEKLRKNSNFSKKAGGLIQCYETVAAQTDRPEIINCTPGSAMTCFPMGELANFR